MLFNSVAFFVFAAVVLAVYHSIGRRPRAQNVVLLVASYTFYGFWDWRFTILIAASTAIDFVVGARLAGAPSGRRRHLLAVSLVANLGILGFFKYFNFFVESTTDLLALLGLQADMPTLEVILPVGISFYTFQTLSYSIDIYRGRLEPCRSFIDFALFVSFFPQLVAGPIERAVSLLPQIQRPRRVAADQVDSGVFLILWGLFKKVVIADNLAQIADRVFNNYASYDGADLAIGVVAFAGQIYGDFSGYSDIARGIARLLGFELVLNFRLPYFARSPSDFWRRWHVSLSAWLRDYLYIPLGGNRDGTWRTYRNLAITMLLGGLWHGAAWNFVLWGAYHGALLVVFKLLAGDREPRNAPVRPLSHLLQVSLMFVLTAIGWVLFRCTSTAQIGHFLLNTGVSLSNSTAGLAGDLAFFSAPLLAIQLWQARTGDLLAPLRLHVLARAIFYALLICGIAIFGVRDATEFIYFQF